MFRYELTHQYQPIVDMIDFQLVRHEALLRIDGIDDIEALTRQLEMSGEITEVDLRTLACVLQHLDGRQEFDGSTVAINVSAVSLCNREFQSKALYLLANRHKGIDVSLEITESAPIVDMEVARTFIRNVQDMGCTVGMDDFGDGFASLQMVDDLHLDYLKLSAHLTEHVLKSDASIKKIEEAIVHAKDRGIAVVAEHVDNIPQYLCLRDLGIQYGQGWLFAKADSLVSDTNQFQVSLKTKIRQAVRPRAERSARETVMALE